MLEGQWRRGSQPGGGAGAAGCARHPPQAALGGGGGPSRPKSRSTGLRSALLKPTTRRSRPRTGIPGQLADRVGSRGPGSGGRGPSSRVAYSGLAGAATGGPGTCSSRLRERPVRARERGAARGRGLHFPEGWGSAVTGKAPRPAALPGRDGAGPGGWGLPRGPRLVPARRPAADGAGPGGAHAQLGGGARLLRGPWQLGLQEGTDRAGSRARRGVAKAAGSAAGGATAYARGRCRRYQATGAGRGRGCVRMSASARVRTRDRAWECVHVCTYGIARLRGGGALS